MSDEVTAQGTPVSKKRDASSPLQESIEIRKKSKSHIQGSADKSLEDIDESCSNNDSSDSEADQSKIPLSNSENMASKSVSTDSRLSDEDIDRIALRVKSIMTSEIKLIIDSSICETKKEYDAKIRKLETNYDAKIQKLESENSNLREEVEDLRSELCGFKQDIVNMKWRDDENEQYSRRNSLRISGVSETDTRPADDIVLEIANKYNINVRLSDIDRSHRVGREMSDKTRAILVKFTSYRAKREFMLKKKDLAEGLYFNEDLTKTRGELLYESRKLFKAGHLLGAWSYSGKVYVKDANGAKYEVRSIEEVHRFASRSPITRRQKQNKAAANSNETDRFVSELPMDVQSSA